MNSEKICPSCGTRYKPNERYCVRDGTALRSLAGADGELAGQIVADRFHVLRKIGEGGMGQVYLAEHVRMSRKCALKVMNARIAQYPDAISRFNREAENASRINHPNVAAIYDFGETSDGLIFLAMEYVDGPPLTKLIESDGTLSPGRAANILTQIADALTAAHDMGIVHRDLKPDNILVTRSRSGGDLVKVVDFGIAKARDSSSQSLTGTGMIVGTPEYMSPEQCAGEQVDERSDLYSLGLVAYKMLTGSLPFVSNSSREAVMVRFVETPKPLAEVKPEVNWPQDLQAALDKALERQPELRYESAQDFAKDFGKAVVAMHAGTSNPGILGPDSVTQGNPVASRAVTVAVRPAPTPEPRQAASAVAEPPTTAVTPPQTLRRETAAPNRMRMVGTGVAVIAVAASLVLYTTLRARGAREATQGAAAVVPHQGTPADSAPVAGGKAVPVQQPQTKLPGSAPADTKTTTAPVTTAVAATDGRTRTSAPPFAFVAPRLNVRVSRLAAVLQAPVEGVVKNFEGASLLGNETDRADLVINADAGGGLKPQGTDGSPRGATIPAASFMDPLAKTLRRELALKTLATLDSAHAPAAVQLGVKGDKRTFAISDTIRIRVVSAMDGYLTLVDIDANGVANVLHPSGIADVGRVHAGAEIVFQKEFLAGPPAGDGVVRAIITERPLGLQKGDPTFEAADGAAFAREICRDLERLVRDGARQWATQPFAYTIRR